MPRPNIHRLEKWKWHALHSAAGRRVGYLIYSQPVWLQSNSVKVWTLLIQNRKIKQIRKVIPARNLKLLVLLFLWFVFFFFLCDGYPGKMCSIEKHVRNSKNPGDLLLQRGVDLSSSLNKTSSLQVAAKSDYLCSA